MIDEQADDATTYYSIIIIIIDPGTACASLFAARIAELAWEQDASFSADVAALNSIGDALCLGGETANGCRDRLYASRPSLLTDGSNDGCANDEALCQDGTSSVARTASARRTGGGA